MGVRSLGIDNRHAIDMGEKVPITLVLVTKYYVNKHFWYRNKFAFQKTAIFDRLKRTRMYETGSRAKKEMRRKLEAEERLKK